MRSRLGSAAAGHGRRIGGCFPRQGDPHPTYMYGVFEPEVPDRVAGGPLDRALLAAHQGMAARGLPRHPHHHPDPLAPDAAFMFGGATVPPCALPEAGYYFWALGRG